MSETNNKVKTSEQIIIVKLFFWYEQYEAVHRDWKK